PPGERRLAGHRRAYLGQRPDPLAEPAQERGELPFPRLGAVAPEALQHRLRHGLPEVVPVVGVDQEEVAPCRLHPLADQPQQVGLASALLALDRHPDRAPPGAAQGVVHARGHVAHHVVVQFVHMVRWGAPDVLGDQCEVEPQRLQRPQLVTGHGRTSMESRWVSSMPIRSAAAWSAAVSTFWFACGTRLASRSRSSWRRVASTSPLATSAPSCWRRSASRTQSRGWRASRRYAARIRPARSPAGPVPGGTGAGAAGVAGVAGPNTSAGFRSERSRNRFRPASTAYNAPPALPLRFGGGLPSSSAHHRHPLSVSSWTKHRPCIRLATNPSWLRRVRDLPVRSVPMSCFSSGLDTSRPRLINVSR